MPSRKRPLSSPGTPTLLEKGSIAHGAFSETPVSFAVDISGSTYGQTLTAEKSFIQSVSRLLSPRARFDSKVLPWDNSAHPILSVAQLHNLEDRGGTDPGALLNSPTHRATLKESSLWFLMTDGLIPSDIRAKFARDIATHGLHGISCIIVVFGNPSTGPASCDISVGVGVFAVVPNCAFLFCNETNGDLRAMQTKGTFNVLLKGQPHPVFDANSRWDSLPQVSIADFAAVAVPAPQRLSANEVALQDSLVIDMDDLFANRLSNDQIVNIFSNVEHLDNIRMTMQARNQQDDFRHWLQQQAIVPDDPLFKPRQDMGSKAESLFIELADLINRELPPPKRLQARLRAAYRENMRRFVLHAQHQIQGASQRQTIIESVSQSFECPIHLGSAISPSSGSAASASAPFRSVPVPAKRGSTSIFQTPRDQIGPEKSEPPGAPPRGPRGGRHSFITPSTNAESRREATEEQWGSWESSITEASLRGLLYTTGFRSIRGSFKGTCPVCGANGMTLAWLFCAPSVANAAGLHKPPPTPSENGGKAGFPAPGSRTPLAFPLAMGHFAETAGVLSPLPVCPRTPRPQVLGASSKQTTPALVCEPCSAFYTRHGALSFGVTAALPLVRSAENRDAMTATLADVFERRFADGDLSQVFLSVLALNAGQRPVASTPPTAYRLPSTPAPSEMEFDIQATMAAAAAARTFRAAAEWAIRDLVYSVVAPRELSVCFSLPSDPQGPAWPLATALAGSFEELDAGRDGDAPAGETAKAVAPPPPLLRYPLPGFITILKAAPLLGVAEEVRRRAAFQRLLFLVCEELDRAADRVPHSQSVAELFGGLLGRPPSTGPGPGADGCAKWIPALEVRIQSLRFTSLLGQANYGMMSRADDFRYLEDPLTAVWVGPAVALFLHALFSVVTTSPRMKAAETFQVVMGLHMVGSALLRPEELSCDDVGGILALMPS